MLMADGYLQDTCKVGLLVGKPAANPGSYNQRERSAPSRGASSPDADGSVGRSLQTVEPRMELRTVAGESPREREAARKRLYGREEALLRRLQAGEDTPELRAELARVREAIRRSLRHEDGEAEDDHSP